MFSSWSGQSLARRHFSPQASGTQVAVLSCVHSLLPPQGFDLVPLKLVWLGDNRPEACLSEVWLQYIADDGLSWNHRTGFAHRMSLGLNPVTRETNVLRVNHYSTSRCDVSFFLQFTEKHK